MSLKNFQQKIGVAADGAWGPNTFKHAVKYYDMTPVRAAHFFAQCAHESANFRTLSENLNYSADALRKIFGKYFPSDDLAESYARNPEKIANRTATIVAAITAPAMPSHVFLGLSFGENLCFPKMVPVV